MLHIYGRIHMGVSSSVMKVRKPLVTTYSLFCRQQLTLMRNQWNLIIVENSSERTVTLFVQDIARERNATNIKNMGKTLAIPQLLGVM